MKIIVNRIINNIVLSDLPAVESCPFKNCVPWKCLVIDASNLSSSLSVTLFHQLFPNLTHIKELLYFNLTGHNLHPGYGVRMETENQGNNNRISKESFYMFS